MLESTLSTSLRHLREYIRANRVSQRLSQKELAARSGVSLHSLRKFEQHGKISLESFLSLTQALGLLYSVIDNFKVKSKLPKSIANLSSNDRRRPMDKARVRK